MRNKCLKSVFFPAVLLLATLPASFAYSSSTAGEGAVHTEAASPPALPSMSVFGKAIGGVTPGDLFYVDVTGAPADITVTLSLTNSNQLVHCYRYLILKVGVYVKDDSGEWKKALAANGAPLPDRFVSLLNAQVSFTLAGYARYKVTLDGGSFYSVNANVDSGSLLPQFYLEAA